MKKFLISISGVLLIAYVTLAAFMYFKQRELLYFPVAETDNDYVHSLQVKSGDDSLKVWKINPGRSRAVIYLGGNAEDVVGNAKSFNWHFTDETVYLVNYRGYGGSSGKPTEENLYQDALAVYDAISPAHDEIFVIGRSLGSGVATYLATSRPVQKLVLVTPYDSIAELAASIYWFAPVDFILKDRFDSIGRAPAIKAPVLVVFAETDYVVPHENTRRLIDAFAEGQVKEVTIKDSDHNWINRQENYFITMHNFIAES